LIVFEIIGILFLFVYNDNNDSLVI